MKFRVVLVKEVIAVEYQPSRVFIIRYDEELEKSCFREIKLQDENLDL